MGSKKGEYDIVDGCFFTWVDVTGRYSNKLEKSKKFNDYEKAKGK